MRRTMLFALLIIALLACATVQAGTSYAIYRVYKKDGDHYTPVGPPMTGGQYADALSKGSYKGAAGSYMVNTYWQDESGNSIGASGGSYYLSDNAGSFPTFVNKYSLTMNQQGAVYVNGQGGAPAESVASAQPADEGDYLNVLIAAQTTALNDKQDPQRLAKSQYVSDLSTQYLQAVKDKNEEDIIALQYQISQVGAGTYPAQLPTPPAGAASPTLVTAANIGPSASPLANTQTNLAYLQQKIDSLQGKDAPEAQTYVMLQQNYRDAIDRGDWENVAGYEDQIKALQATDAQAAGTTAGTTGPPGTFQDPKGAADSNKIASGAKAISDFLHQEYPGIAGLGGMLVGAVPALSDWKAAVDKAFCDTIILGGKTCWVQKICESSSDYPGGDGTLVDSTWGNNTLTITFYAHIEAQRSEPVISVNPDGTTKTEYLYKITYSIRNPQSKDANAYQVRFFYAGGSYDWYPGWQPLHKGDAISMTGNSALVAYSTRLYSRVCLVFQKSVEVNGQSTMQVCNTIVQYTGGATAIAGAPAGTAATSEQGAATGTPAAAGAGF